MPEKRKRLDLADALNQEMDILHAAINGLIRVADPKPGSEVEAVSCGLEGQFWRVKNVVDQIIDITRI